MTTPGRAAGSADRPAIAFADAAEWRRWLEFNHDSSTGIWMLLAKKHVADRGLTWADAVPEALCFGWIDSQVQRVDEDWTRQRWTPRKRGSTWSNVNVELVRQLTEQGRMAPAGLAAFAARREERTGIYSFESGSHEWPPDLAALLAADPAAAAWWERATASYRRICVSWVTGAKREVTREARMRQFLELSARGQLVPSQRYGELPAWARRARADLGLGDPPGTGQ